MSEPWPHHYGLASALRPVSDPVVPDGTRARLPSRRQRVGGGVEDFQVPWRVGRDCGSTRTRLVRRPEKYTAACLWLVMMMMMMMMIKMMMMMMMMMRMMVKLPHVAKAGWKQRFWWIQQSRAGVQYLILFKSLVFINHWAILPKSFHFLGVWNRYLYL